MAGNDASRRLHGWAELHELAARHAGFFTARQVMRAGCEARVRAGLEDGSIARAAMGMLRIAGSPVGPLDEYAMWAAWFDDEVAVSHQSAADLHGLGRLRPRFLHLSVPAGRPPVTPRVVVLRRALAGDEVESAGPFLVTTPVRTVLDLAEGDIAQAALDEVVADAVAIGRCAAVEIRAAGTGLAPRAAARLHRALATV